MVCSNNKSIEEFKRILEEIKNYGLVYDEKSIEDYKQESLAIDDKLYELQKDKKNQDDKQTLELSDALKFRTEFLNAMMQKRKHILEKLIKPWNKLLLQLSNEEKIDLTEYYKNHKIEAQHNSFYNQMVTMLFNQVTEIYLQEDLKDKAKEINDLALLILPNDTTAKHFQNALKGNFQHSLTEISISAHQGSKSDEKSYTPSN